eukprot:SAG11_NODE_7541_length_1131_cov_1.667636_2_plen_186_part_00
MKCLIRNRKGHIDFGLEEDAYALFVRQRDEKALEIRDGQRLRLTDFQVCEEMINKYLKPASAVGCAQAKQKKVEELEQSVSEIRLRENMARELNGKSEKENEKLIQQSSKLEKENKQLKHIVYTGCLVLTLVVWVECVSRCQVRRKDLFIHVWRFTRYCVPTVHTKFSTCGYQSGYQSAVIPVTR